MSVDVTKISYVQKSLQTARAIMTSRTKDANNEVFYKRFAFFRLKKLVDSFINEGKRDQRWVIMPGLRGTGKSTLLGQIYLYLIESLKIDQVDILYVSIDDVTDQLGCGIKDILESYETFTAERFETTSKLRFLLIDEAHFDDKWARVLKELYERAPNVFVIVTGSSALALQSDPHIGADIARRVQIEKLDPLRFTEYTLLKKRIKPPGLGSEIASALFNSRTASEVHQRLNAIQSEVATYWSKIDVGDDEKYLTHGSFPYSLGLEKEEAYNRIVRVTKEVFRRDITAYKGKQFDLSTIKKFPQLVTLLSAWEDVSIEKLRQALDIKSKETVTDMVEALKRAQIIHAIPAHGGTRVRVTRPPRYTFSATSIKTAFLWSIGQFVGSPDQYGKLLEELFVQFFDVDVPRRLVDMYRIEGSGECDFMLVSGDNKKIACEIGYGHKTTTQLKKTMGDIECKYGILISDDELAVFGDVVIVPKRYLFTY